MKLLKETATLNVVCDFLKNKGLHHSASSWDKLLSERIIPSLEEKQITVNDLIALLQRAEEYGRKHTFLYKCLPSIAEELLNERRMEAILKSSGLDKLIDKPAILDQPESPTIADVRWLKNPNGITEGFLIKIIEARISMEFVGEESDGNLVSRQYKQVKERAVNVVKLDTKGNLEIRIASQKNSTLYKDNLVKMWDLVGEIFPRLNFAEISLHKAKDRLWNDKAELQSLIRYSDSTLKNESGTVLKAASGSFDSDLFDDTGATDSLATFLSHKAHCETFNIWFKANAPLPSKDIHVLLSGEINEFAITAHCNEEDYAYVLGQLRKFNT